MSGDCGQPPGFTAEGVEIVGYHDVGGKPVFKLAMQVVDPIGRSIAPQVSTSQSREGLVNIDARVFIRTVVLNALFVLMLMLVVIGSYSSTRTSTTTRTIC